MAASQHSRPANFPWLALVVLSWVAVLYWLYRPGAAADTHAYWAAWQGGLYDVPWHGRSGWSYVYSPAFAQAIWLLTLLPFTAFVALWLVLNAGALVALAGPLLGLLLVVINREPVQLDLITGNIPLILGVAIVLGFRWPAAWAFVLLTKVTPGVGLLWFVARREWRALGIALGATVAIAGVSFAIAPHLWIDWGQLLIDSLGIGPNPRATLLLPGALWLRMPVAAVIVWFAGRQDQRWLVPIGCYIGYPSPTVMQATLLAAVIPLLPARWWGRLPQGWSPLSRAGLPRQ